MNKRYSTIIIDDEAPARLGLLNLLKEFPETFDVIDVAQNGTEAQQKIEALNPDIIFLDIEMPIINGFYFLEGLKTKIESLAFKYLDLITNSSCASKECILTTTKRKSKMYFIN